MNSKLFPELIKAISLFWYENEKECLVCTSKSAKPVCLRCQEEYFCPEVKRCMACGKLFRGEASRCEDCLAGIGPKGLDKVIALGHYEKSWKEFIRRVKYQGQPYLLLELEDIIVKWAFDNLPAPDAIIAVPMHPDKLASRGFNQAEVLASVLGRGLGIPLNTDLVRYRDTPSQTELGRKERIQNLKGAFTIRQGKKIEADIIWLVDDVTTTGTTLGECAETLKRSGAKEVYGLCLGAGREEEQ